MPCAAIKSSPRVSCKASSRSVLSGLSVSVVSNARAFLRAAIAS